MSDMFGDMFGSMFQRKGEDLHAEITVSFDEAAFGCDKIITLQDESGMRHTLQVRIPAGIDDGKSIRLRGKGSAGVRGGESGDLLIKVKVMEKAGFERRGLDIYTTVKIPFTTAVFGGEAIVSTLNGKVVCKIREGTQSGTKIRLRGKGIVSMNNPNVHGDQYVTVQILACWVSPAIPDVAFGNGVSVPLRHLCPAVELAYALHELCVHFASFLSGIRSDGLSLNGLCRLPFPFMTYISIHYCFGK